jgi:pimeloyl-ACP methyl ester carboxylesterase
MTPFELPKPHQILDLRMDDGAHIRVRRHGNPQQHVRVLLSHGNGFAIDGYFPFWRLLLDRFDVIVFDFRNHGWNHPVAHPPNHHYIQFASDLEVIHHAVMGLLGPKPTVGAFHSLSARTAIKYAVEGGWLWDALVLFDPPNVPPADHPLHEIMVNFDHRLAAWAQNRLQRFASPSEMADIFRGLRAHQHWIEGAYELMAQAILHRESHTGDWVLTCPGELEASVYLSNIPLQIWPEASDFGGPVKIIAADPTVERPGLPAQICKLLSETNGFDYAYIPDTGHMLQIEKPEATYQVMMSFLASCGLVAATD